MKNRDKTSSIKSEDINALKEILEIEKLSRLLEQFYSATGLSNFIVDLKGNVLHGVGWKNICTEFHRKHKASSARCLKSDTILANRLKKKEKYSIYICQNGMVDVATPIIIDGVHVANLFVGQFFFETPDKEFFIKQAEELGFDKEKYLTALEECQVYNKETILKYLDFLGGLINIISEANLKAIKIKDQNEEKDKRAAELVIANRELIFQTGEKTDRAAELVIADKELAFQTGEKADRAAELIIANKELAYQNEEKDKRAAELVLANRELAFQTGEKADRAAELVIADEELAFQTGEKADRAAELIIANKELIFQNEEKEKRAAELLIANKKLVIQKEKMKERTAQLESANKELESLSYSISHDLKAPLRHIIGYDALLVKKYINLLPDEGRQYLKNISSATKTMGELIDGLLQFSKTGRTVMKQSVLNMNDIVGAYIQPILEEDIEHRIVFNIGSMPLAFGDFEMIKSVWSNLIENAVKFTRKNELAKITIDAERTENEIIYHIIDNGAGFDMSYASKLFDVFQRLHSREDYEGTGIGLATVQKVIKRHGGRIWAEAKVGEGAAFYFTLTKRKKR